MGNTPPLCGRIPVRTTTSRGSPLLGIECDGVTYPQLTVLPDRDRSPPTAPDDMARGDK